MENIKRLHLLISGDVTGVGFRHGTLFIARELELTGWVRNTQDYKVEIVAEGEREKVKRLISWAKTGPPLAQVTDVNVEWEKATGKFTSFEIKR